MLRIIKQFYPLLLCIAALVAAFIVITGYEADYLACVEEQSLFLDTPLFFRELTAVPGGLLSYVSCWFTEYLHDPTEGVRQICFWGGLTALLFWRTYRLQTLFAPLLLVPIAAVLLTQFMPGYWIYLLKFRGFFFAAPIGFCLALLLISATSNRSRSESFTAICCAPLRRKGSASTATATSRAIPTECRCTPD